MSQREWKTYLVEQAKLHPCMRPQDVYKLMFQAAFGAEHLLQDRDAACAYFLREYEALVPEKEPLFEEISEKLCRVNMRAWKQRNLPWQWLFEMFVGSVALQERNDFTKYVDIAKEAVQEGAFEFSSEAFLQYSEEYDRLGIRPVHHSDEYRVAEQPAYRLVNSRYLRLLPILEAMTDTKQCMAADEQIAEENRPFVIAIDGRCASGKSTMAQMLSELTGAGVVHMDDFFLPMELRSRERLEEPGGNVHYERFEEEVLPFLKTAEAFSYRTFDCSKMQLGEMRPVAASHYIVVEGAYSQHPIFGEYADLRVFSNVAADVQLDRIAQRDGEELLTMFKERWIPMEEKYFATYEIREKCDVVVTN